MNQELVNVIKIYCTETYQELKSYLSNKNKDTLIGMFVDLLTMYINDKNSSTIRELITVTLAGYTHKKEKIGYNGFKQVSDTSGEIIKCEAKPKNLNTEEFEKYKKGERKTRPAKLDGGGNFTDYTRKRFEKDKKANLNMLVSGFINGKLVYILEFPFNTPTFIKKLESQIENWETKLEGSKNKKGQFLRSANFDFRDYSEASDLKVVYLLPKSQLEKYKKYISRDFYKFLWSKAT